MSAKNCYVYMKKDLEKVGMAKQLVTVSKGFAENFLIPNGYGVIVEEQEVASYKNRSVAIAVKKEVLESKTSMLAEKIKMTPIILKEKIHDDNKLYGSIKEDQIVKALKDKGITINRKQIKFDKSIKTLGDFKVLIRLSSKLQPELAVKIVSL